MDSENKSELAKKEEEIMEFWETNQIFGKSLSKESPNGDFVFYEGPPTANGKPGIHHLESRSFKDAFPRYKTMRGFHVRRKAGWDTHGLPVELQVEKELGLTSKKQIEEYGIDLFNKKCKESVWTYIDLWEKFSNRIGYWVDLKNPYITYKNEYIESVWNIVKKITDDGLLYKDYKVLPWCPRCGTALSSHELAQGYENVKDLSVYVKLKVLGIENTYFIAWTTTPWTLPGNVALAVGENMEYVYIKDEINTYIVAKERVEKVFEGKNFEVLKKVYGKDLVGMEYEPLYPFLKNNLPESQKENLDKAFKIYSADFVTTEDGTGIVHTAVMYGVDDFELGSKIGLPKYHLVDESGNFTQVTEFLAGKFVKDEETAVDIIKDLAHRDLLFKKEKYEHSYPHCWRCKTPLIYYARDSWYIRMSDLRDELINQNEEINWEPDHIKNGRFGEWLKEVKDWAISRERYWGTPLPVWQCTSCDKKETIGSIADLKKRTKRSGNKYFAMRHGEADHNILDICSGKPEHPHHLTEKGRQQAEDAARKITDVKIDLIITSPYVRAKETAEIVAGILNISSDKIKIDDRLSELGWGDLDMHPYQEYVDLENEKIRKYDDGIPGGETFQMVKNRVGDLIYEVENEYSEKNILFVGHGILMEVMPAIVNGEDKEKSFVTLMTADPKLGEVSEYDFAPLPHNDDYELDLHKPYIDEVKLSCDCKGEMKRTKEVMDVWFDSGAMPFAEDHYPFENKERVESIGYPADYISEAVDQTRGWFYTLHAIGTLMGRGKAYKNVTCLGHILDEKGKKMSKSLGNIVDPWTMLDKYGADALRLWMYSINQPGDSKNFDEKTVDEIVKKTFLILSNVLNFYDLYKNDEKADSNSENVLDKWIISRLSELAENCTKYMDDYRVFEPVRMIRDFVTDFSTWYIRRSRERFKDSGEDKERALKTTRFVIMELSKLMAPFSPFFAEYMYQKVRSDEDAESVHLADWPEINAKDSLLIEEMEKARGVVTVGLEMRQKSGLKVRQPLASMTINEKLSAEMTEIVKDELNVKEIIVDEKGEIALDTNISHELKQEGIYRELLRAIQDLRKQNNLNPGDLKILEIQTDEEGKAIIEAWKSDLQKTASISEIIFKENDGEKINANGIIFIVNGVRPH